MRCTCSHAQGCTLRCATRGYLTVPYRTHPGAQISEILKVIPGTTDPVNKYFSLPCTNPGGHLAQPVLVQECVHATKLAFCQTQETPEPLNEYIFYNTDITPEGKKRYLPGVSTVRHGV